MSTEPVDLAAVRALCEAATIGDWIPLYSRDVLTAVISPRVSAVCMDCTRDDDAKFIAASRTLVPAMADEIEQLQQLIAESCCLKTEANERIANAQTEAAKMFTPEIERLRDLLKRCESALCQTAANDGDWELANEVRRVNKETT